MPEAQCKFLVAATIYSSSRMVAEEVQFKQRGGLDTLAKNKLNNKFKRVREHITTISTALNKSGLILIKSHLRASKQPLRIMIDSGAQCSVASKKAIDLTSNTIRPSAAKLVDAQGEIIEILGETDIELFLGEDPYQVTVVVTPVLMDAADIILGMSFLNKNKTALYTQPGQSPKFILNDKVIPLIREGDYKGYHVYAIKHIGEENIIEWA